MLIWIGIACERACKIFIKFFILKFKIQRWDFINDASNNRIQTFSNYRDNYMKTGQ